MNGQSWVWSTSILNCLTCGGVGSQRGNFFLWLDLCENYPPLSRQCELWYVSSFPMLSSLFWCEYISGKMNKCLLNICRLDWYPTSVQKGCCEFNLCQGSHPLPCTLQMKMFNETFLPVSIVRLEYFILYSEFPAWDKTLTLSHPLSESLWEVTILSLTIFFRLSFFLGSFLLTLTIFD